MKGVFAAAGGAAKSGLPKKDRVGGQLLRAASARKTARSDYEEHQILLQLQAVERMKEMVQVRAASLDLQAPHTDDTLCCAYALLRMFCTMSS